MPYNGAITKEEANKLLSHLDYFQDFNSIFYTEKNGYKLESQEVGEFRRELDNIGFLLVFDWTQWITDNEVYKDIDNNIQDEIMNADLETLRKITTSYIRGDRFNEGLFIHVILKGHIKNILLRLKELEDEL